MAHVLGPVFAAAESYAKACLSVIPILPDGSKKPFCSWKRYESEIASAEERSRWWANGSGFGIAVVAGKVSGNLECLDFDDQDLFDIWVEQIKIRAPGLGSKLVITGTPRPGRQCLYRCETPIPGNQIMAQGERIQPETGEIRLKTLIETRGEGGYFLVPPSPAACHKNKKPYSLVRGELTRISLLTPAERALLLQCAAALNEYAEPRIVSRAPTAASDAPEGRLRPGTDYNARGSWEGLLTRSGWVLEGTRGEVEEWKRPGKTERGISATLHAVAPGVFYVFSSNAAPFAAGHGYDLFAARAWLEFDGDFKACAKALGDEGYGQARAAPPKPTARVPEKVTETKNGGETEGASFASFAGSANNTPPTELEPEAFWGLAGEIVRAIDPHTEGSPAAVLISFLVGFGCMLGRGPHIFRDGMRHTGNEFAALVGPSGVGRKGTATRRANEILDAVSGAQARAEEESKYSTVFGTGTEYGTGTVTSPARARGLSSGEGLIYAVRDAKKAKKANESDDGIADKRLFVIEEELSQVLTVMGRDGNTLSMVLRSAWDGLDLSVTTRTSPLSATGAHISVLGHITDEELRRKLTETDKANGFANRFMWFYTTRSKLLPKGGGKISAAPLVYRLREAVNHAAGTGHVEFDREAEWLWDEGGVYAVLTNPEPGLCGSVTQRGDAHVVRLALLQAVLNGERVIRVPHLLAALALWDYSLQTCRYIFGLATGDDVADGIEAALQDVYPGYLTRTEISAKLSRHTIGGNITRSLKLLYSLGRAVGKRLPTDGRYTEIWTAIPADGSEKSELSALHAARKALAGR